MAGGSPEVGDKVSWNWGGGAPGGTVAEKKTEGEIAIKSKKGNTIKKNASKDNPAVHIERSGNDVVKRVSELNEVKKGSGAGGKGKRKHEDEDKQEDEDEKEKEEKQDDDKIEKNKQGKDVRAGGKKQKQTQKQEDNKTEQKDSAKIEEEIEEDETAKPKANEKKKAGRPKGAASAATKEKKKLSKPRNTEGVSGRTRSQKK